MRCGGTAAEPANRDELPVVSTGAAGGRLSRRVRHYASSARCVCSRVSSTRETCMLNAEPTMHALQNSKPACPNSPCETYPHHAFGIHLQKHHGKTVMTLLPDCGSVGVP